MGQKRSCGEAKGVTQTFPFSCTEHTGQVTLTPSHAHMFILSTVGRDVRYCLLERSNALTPLAVFSLDELETHITGVKTMWLTGACHATITVAHGSVVPIAAIRLMVRKP